MFDKVAAVIADTLSCEVSEISHETSISEDLGADSLDAVELNMALEEKFSVKIDDEELAGLKTVNDIIHCIEGHL